jgi:hypothetical protein
MTAAAMAAKILDDVLGTIESLDSLNPMFQKRLSKIHNEIWMLATGEDMRFPGTEGGNLNRVDRQMHRYMDRVAESMPYNDHAVATMLGVINLMKSPSALFDPRVVAGVVRNALRKNAKPNRATQELPVTS